MNIHKAGLDLDFVKQWMKKGLHPILLSILSRRGVKDENELSEFLLPFFENMSSPFLYTSIITAYNRIKKAADNGEKVIIFGDRDVDGITSISLIYDFLQNLDIEVFWDLPVKDEPFGLSQKKVTSWKGCYDLVITVDCGITGGAEIDLLSSFGIDTIILDHHTPPEALPQALAVVNPKCEEAVLFDDISACVVCFMFILGFTIYNSHLYNKDIFLAYPAGEGWTVDHYNNLILQKRYYSKKGTPLTLPLEDALYLYNQPDTQQVDKTGLAEVISGADSVQLISLEPLKHEFAGLFSTTAYISKTALFNYLFRTIPYIETLKKKYVPYAALSTLSDIMPLKKSNRSLVQLGLEYIRKGLSEKITALCSHLKLDHEVLTSTDLAWKIIPVLNAPGRMGNAKLGVNFLLQENFSDYIDTILGLNEKRKQEGMEAFKTFVTRIDSNRKEYGDNLLFFYTDDIYRGITGIIANKLSDKAGCPAIVATLEGGFYSGSIRGDSHYHFAEFLDKASDILSEYGGHENAAGFRFTREQLGNFITFLKDNAGLLYTEYNSDELKIDAEIPHEYLDYSLLGTLRPLEPYGEINENPVLYTPALSLVRFFAIGKEKNHLKLVLQTKTGKQITGMFWNIKDGFKKYLASKQTVDVVYTVELNNYGGRLYPNLNIIDIN